MLLVNIRVSQEEFDDARERLWEAPVALSREEWGYSFNALHQELFAFRGHTDAIVDATVSPDGKYLLSISRNQTAMLWNLGSGKHIATLEPQLDKRRTTTSCFGGQYLARASVDGDINIWDVPSGRISSSLKVASRRVHKVELGPQSRHALALTSQSNSRNASALDGNIILWNTEESDSFLELRADTKDCIDTQLSPGARQALLLYRDSPAAILDATTGEITALLNHENAQARSAEFSSDGKLIVTGSTNEVRVWKSDTAEMLHELKRDLGPITDVSFDPLGNRVIMASTHGVLIWNYEVGEETMQIGGATEFGSFVDFSPDGMRILTGEIGGAVRLWDAQTYTELTALEGVNVAVLHRPFFTADSTRVITVNQDAVRVWDAKNRLKLRLVRDYESFMEQIEYVGPSTRGYNFLEDGRPTMDDVAPYKLDDPALASLTLSETYDTPEEERRARLMEWKRVRYEQWVRENVDTGQQD